MSQVLVPHAMKATILRKVCASSLISTMLAHLTLDAVFGTGTTKFVWNAHTDGSLMLKNHAFQLMITATITLIMVPVLAASLDTLSVKVSVCQPTLSAKL
jgi:hypothetical protein